VQDIIGLYEQYTTIVREPVICPNSPVELSLAALAGPELLNVFTTKISLNTIIPNIYILREGKKENNIFLFFKRVIFLLPL
jgi:hypothetical protein